MDRDKRGYNEIYRGKGRLINLCKSLSICIPAQVKGKFRGKAVEELRPVLEKYQISEEEIYSGSLAFGLILSVAVFLCTLIAGGNYLFAVVVLITTFAVLFNLPVIILLGEARQLRATYLSYADIIFEALFFSKITTGDIYNAFVAIADLEETVSLHFKKALKEVLLEGGSAEKAVINFVLTSPLKALKEHISALLRPSTPRMSWHQAIREARREIREEYQRYTLELESRLAMVTGISMFLPLLLLMWFIVPGSEGLLYAILPIQLGSTVILSRFLLGLKQNIF